MSFSKYNSRRNDDFLFLPKVDVASLRFWVWNSSENFMVKQQKATNADREYENFSGRAVSRGDFGVYVAERKAEENPFLKEFKVCVFA